MDKICYRNPSKSEVIGRCGGDGKKRMTTQNRQKSRTLKHTHKKQQKTNQIAENNRTVWLDIACNGIVYHLFRTTRLQCFLILQQQIQRIIVSGQYQIRTRMCLLRYLRFVFKRFHFNYIVTINHIVRLS